MRGISRILLSVFVVYLIGLLGYVAPSHKHESADGNSRSHQDCQLCQVSAEPFVAAQPCLCPETPAAPVSLVEAVWEPVFACRHQPFASRAPPSA